MGEVDNDTYLTIQQFLYREAALLDRRDYRGWMSLLAEDVTYRVSAQVNRDADVGPLPYAIIDETAARLRARLEQVATAKLTHAENPPTLTRRMVSNVLVTRGDRDNEYMVTSNLLIFRTRPEVPEGALYAGERADILRRVNGTLLIARREVVLDHAVLQGRSQHTVLTVSRHGNCLRAVADFLCSVADSLSRSARRRSLRQTSHEQCRHRFPGPAEPATRRKRQSAETSQ